MLMKVHAEQPRHPRLHARGARKWVAAMAHERGLPLRRRSGSGTLTDFAAFGLPPRADVRAKYGAGADLVTFPATKKLFGGPQAGLLVGRELTPASRRIPLKRAARRP